MTERQNRYHHNRRLRSRTHRGLSSVVGAIFMVIIIVGAVNVMIWSFQEQNKITENLIEKANSNFNNLNEGLYVSDIRINNNKLNLTIANSGGSAAKLAAIYIVNETSSQQYRYDLNIAVDGRSPVKNIGQSDPSVVIQDNTQYSIKVVSESGNAVTTRIKPVSQVALPMSLHVIPATVTTLENVTLLFSVNNNLTDGEVLTSPVTPVLTKSLSCSPYPSENCKFTDYVSPTAAIIPKGSNSLFKWVFQVTAPVGTTMTFNASLANAKEGNYVIEKGRVEIIQEAVISSEVIVGNTLLQKPEVFVIAPGPFGQEGQGTQRGVWGIVVVNPISTQIVVKSVMINLYSSTLAASHKIVDNDCSTEAIRPTTGTWDCPHDGIIRWWHNTADPITIPSYSAYSFLVKVPPGSIPAPEPAYMISATVSTNLGQFSRQGYASNMYHTHPVAIMNVYMTNTTSTSEAIQNSRIFGNMTLTAGESNKRIHIAVVDWEANNGDRSKMESGATLIINVPRGFTNIVYPSGSELSNLGFSSANHTLYADGTTQIRAITSGEIGSGNSVGARVFWFEATVPSGSTTRAYAMHVLLDGKIPTINFPADAFGTFALVVKP